MALFKDCIFDLYLYHNRYKSIQSFLFHLIRLSIMKKKLPLLLQAAFLCLALNAQTTINIAGVEYQADTLEHYKIGPGTYYTAMHYYTPTVKLRTFYLEIDANNPNITFEAVHGKDSLLTTEGISSMAKRKSVSGKNYFTGINADFFVTSGDVGYPIHGSVVEGQIGRTPSNTPHLTFNGSKVVIDNMNIASSYLKIGDQSYPIHDFNKTRNTDHLMLYTTLYGKYTRTNDYGTEVLVKLTPQETWAVNKEVKVVVERVIDKKGNTRMEPNQAVLSGHGIGAVPLQQLKAGDEISIVVDIHPASTSKQYITAMVGGDRTILKNGIVEDNDWAERHPRTAAGYSADQSKVYFCVVDGRSPISSGVTTKHLADIMKNMGAATAINLDGGGSSGLYIDHYGMMNNCSDGRERAVCNGIFAVDKSADDLTVTEILPQSKSVKLPKYGTFTPVILGYNQYGKLIEVDVKDITYTCEASTGSMLEDNRFFANGHQDGMLKAKIGNLETAIHIQYLKQESISLRLDSVLLDGFKDYAIEITATVKGVDYPIDPEVLKWIVDDQTICSIENGRIKGLANGTTYVHGNIDDLNCTLKVNVEIPTTQYASILPLNGEKPWTFKSSSNLSNIKIVEDGISYTYASGRSPFIELIAALKLYSMPDGINLTLNPGNAGIAKMQIFSKDNLSTNNTSYDYTTAIAKNQDAEISLSMTDLLGKEIEHALFPVSLYSIKFPLTASENSAGNNKIQFKKLELVYKNVTVGFENIEQTKRVVVYPNPVHNGKLNINLNSDDCTIDVLCLFDMNGKLIYQAQKQPQSAEINVESLPSGTYLLQITKSNNIIETIKIVITQ